MSMRSCSAPDEPAAHFDNLPLEPGNILPFEVFLVATIEPQGNPIVQLDPPGRAASLDRADTPLQQAKPVFA